MIDAKVLALILASVGSFIIGLGFPLSDNSFLLVAAGLSVVIVGVALLGLGD